MIKRAESKRMPWRACESSRRYSDSIIEQTPRAWRRCLRRFASWLESDRDLSLPTITIRLASTRAFVTTIATPGGGVLALKKLGVTDIEDFFVDYAKTHGPVSKRQMQASLRLFLTFGANCGWVKRHLAGAVPSLRCYRLSNVPRGLNDDEVRQLVTISAKRSRRTHAFALLFAIYGVRRGQVAALRLQDIDWRERTIRFRAQKSGKAVIHELIPSVAEALAAYLRDERPETHFDAVFLRARRPYLPISPGAVTNAIADLFSRLGLENRPCGPHALRHAFATRLLGSGQPLQVIADLLGHRSLAAVSIYAKVDHPRLLEVARQWPEVVS
jgi:integrase/recombinase XerD